MSHFSTRSISRGLEDGMKDACHQVYSLVKALIPGAIQYSWNQRERGLFFILSYLSALAASLICWGTLAGYGFLALAFVFHCWAWFDVLRQRAFPVFRNLLSLTATCTSIGFTLYLPAAGALWVYAFPATNYLDSNAYLVNQSAYNQQEPATGDWVWIRDPLFQEGLAGEVIAVAGQEVEWTGRLWRINDKEVNLPNPGSFSRSAATWRFQLPRDHYLIDQDRSGEITRLHGPAQLIVNRDQIVGRAWARSAPFWDRCLL